MVKLSAKNNFFFAANRNIFQYFKQGLKCILEEKSEDQQFILICPLGTTAVFLNNSWQSVQQLLRYFSLGQFGQQTCWMKLSPIEPLLFKSLH